MLRFSKHFDFKKQNLQSYINEFQSPLREADINSSKEGSRRNFPQSGRDWKLHAVLSSADPVEDPNDSWHD